MKWLLLGTCCLALGCATGSADPGGGAQNAFDDEQSDGSGGGAEGGTQNQGGAASDGGCGGNVSRR